MQSDDLGLVPVAWRYRVYLHELTGEPTWSNWSLSNGPDNPGPAIGGRFEAEPLYDAAAIERLVAERDEARALAGLGCASAAGGPHEIIKQGTYQFCGRCGETIRAPDLRERARAAEAQRDKLKEALQAMVQRFELYLGPDNIHAGHHDLALVQRARQSLKDAP